MAVSSISSGAGLPLDELMNDLRKSENVALTAILSRQTASEARLSAYGRIRSSLEELQKAAKALDNADTYGAFKSTVSNEALGVKASAKATAGDYIIQVQALATSQSLIGAGQTSRIDDIGTGGNITITLSNGKEKTIDLTDQSTSLEGIAKALNNDSDSGVRATIINDGSGAPHKLLLTASNTGEEASVATIRVEGNNELANILSFTKQGIANDGAPAGIFTENAAQNARLNINGIDITSQSNQLEDVLEGVSLTLNKIHTEPISVKIERDDEVAKQTVKDFVAAYNELNKMIKSQTSYDVDTQKASALTGDQLARRVQSDISNALQVVGDGEHFRTLYPLGISVNVKTGDLEIDDTQFDKALAEHPEDVAKLMMGENGLGGKVDKAVNEFIKTQGHFDTEKTGLDKAIKLLAKQYEDMSMRIDAKMETYRQQFLALDKMVVQMQGLSSYLTQQLSMLGNMNSNK
ncbi:MAG: flagellar filament capping protein FliD [Alcaligenes aquatilis]